MVPTKEVNLSLYSDNVLNFSTRFTKLHPGNYANETFGQNVTGLLLKKFLFFFFFNLIKSAKITCSNLRVCLFAMNISLVVICAMLRCQWSLQLSMASAACVYSPNISHRCILNGNGAKCR